MSQFPPPNQPAFPPSNNPYSNPAPRYPSEPPSHFQPTGPDGLAIASLVCGIISLVFVCFMYVGIPVGLAGIICGSLSKTRGGVRTAGIVCSIIGMCLMLTLLVLSLLAVIGVGAAGAAGAAGAPAGPPIGP